MLCGQESVAHKVVINLACILEQKGHCITMDNYFTSIPLFVEMACKAIYARGTIRIGLPTSLKTTRNFKSVAKDSCIGPCMRRGA